MHLSALCFSQVSLCLHQHHPQHDWGKSWPPLHSQGQAYSQNATSHKRALGGSCIGAGSSRISSSRPRVWGSWHFSFPCHQIPSSFEGRIISYPFQLYSRLRQRLLTFTQPLPNCHSHSSIGWPTALVHTHHTDLSSLQRERSQWWHPHSQPTTTRTHTQPATPLWGKPRQVVLQTLHFHYIPYAYSFLT